MLRWQDAPEFFPLAASILFALAIFTGVMPDENWDDVTREHVSLLAMLRTHESTPDTGPIRMLRARVELQPTSRRWAALWRVTAIRALCTMIHRVRSRYKRLRH